MALEGEWFWPRRLSFSQFVILMSTTNCEKDSLLGQTVLPPEPSQFFKNEVFLDNPLIIFIEKISCESSLVSMKAYVCFLIKGVKKKMSLAQNLKESLLKNRMS